MNRIAATLGIVIAATLSACAAPDPHLAEKSAEVHATIPTCSQAKECEVKWGAARDWVLSHAGYKIQSITDSFIETYNSPEGSTHFQVQVVKKAKADGSYSIEASLGCGNVFGCDRPAIDALLDFQRTVNSSFH